MAGDECRSARFDTYQWSWAPVPEWGKTHRSVGTPIERAASTEQRMRPALCSTLLFEFMSFVYG